MEILDFLRVSGIQALIFFLFGLVIGGGSVFILAIQAFKEIQKEGNNYKHHT